MTKYSVRNLGKGFNKRSLVLEVVHDWASKNEANFEALLEHFPDDLQGSLGVVKKMTDRGDLSLKEFMKRFNLNEMILLADSEKVAVCKEWGKDNIVKFIEHSNSLGYQIDAMNGDEEKREGEVDWVAYVDDKCWEIELKSEALEEWDRNWGNFLCLRLESTDEDHYDVFIWIFLGGEKPVAITTLNEENSETINTWFHNTRGCSELSDQNRERYMSECDIMIFDGIPESMLEGVKTRFDEDDAFFVYLVNEEAGKEIGTLPDGLTREKLLEIVSGECISSVYRTISMHEGT